MVISFAQYEYFSPDSQTMVKPRGFLLQLHILTQVRLAGFPSSQFQILTLGYGHKPTVDLNPAGPLTCTNWTSVPLNYSDEYCFFFSFFFFNYLRRRKGSLLYSNKTVP